MGPPSVEIIVTELLDCGARPSGSGGLFSGGMNLDAPRQRRGWSQVRFAMNRPVIAGRRHPRSAFSHPNAVQAMKNGAMALGLADQTYAGICYLVTPFGRELGTGTYGGSQSAIRGIVEAAGVLATEMEASTLFVLASVASARSVAPISRGSSSVPVQAACVLCWCIVSLGVKRRNWLINAPFRWRVPVWWHGRKSTVNNGIESVEETALLPVYRVRFRYHFTGSIVVLVGEWLTPCIVCEDRSVGAQTVVDGFAIESEMGLFNEVSLLAKGIDDAVEAGVV